MAHEFGCNTCGIWVASCGYPDGHTANFDFSTTCGNGHATSGSCGGGYSAEETTESEGTETEIDETNEAA